MTALVVDNTDSMRNAVAAMLNEMGFEKVHQAHNGVEALKYLSRVNFDVILSEWQLPKMDGIELLIKVRKDPKTCQIPFIITSATVEHDEVLRAIKCGVSEYLVKPFSPKMLEERLQRAIEKPVKTNISDQAAKKQTTENKKVQVLIVDDVADNIQIISDLLKKDYQIKATTEGEKAIKICQSRNPPDVVLLDIMMPGMNGLEVCKALKSNAATQHITVIFLTALDQTKHIVQGLELGAVDYITKPINPAVVQARIKTHAKLALNQKSLRQQVDTLIENERLKDEFDRIMQNDLKQPVSEIADTLQLLERFSKDPTKVKHYCQTIENSCGFLKQMLDNMLLLNKLEEGSYDFTPVQVDITPIIENTLNAFKTSISNKRLEVLSDLETRILVNAEEQLTYSLFSNLIKNAVEAAPRGSQISIRAKLKNTFQTIEIHNQGVIPAEITESFFGKYVTAGKKNGAGIGTYAAKLMVDVQKGVIEFETSEQQGTTLMVALPAFSK